MLAWKGSVRMRRRRTVMAALVALPLALGACGKSGDKAAPPPPKMDTPKDSAGEIVKALQEREPKLALAVLVTDDLINQTFECPGGELIKRLTTTRNDVPRRLEKLDKTATVRLGEFDKDGTEEKVLKPGETFEGCKVKATVTVHKSRLELEVTKDGKINYHREAWHFLRFGDEEKWYFFD